MENWEPMTYLEPEILSPPFQKTFAGPCLKVILKSTENQELLIKSASRLSKLPGAHEFRKVFIKPDLTPLQQSQEKALRFELKRRRDAGEDVILRRGKIVTRFSS